MSTNNDDIANANLSATPSTPSAADSTLDPHQMHNSIIRQLVAAVEQLKGFNTAYDALLVEANIVVGGAATSPATIASAPAQAST